MDRNAQKFGRDALVTIAVTALLAALSAVMDRPAAFGIPAEFVPLVAPVGLLVYRALRGRAGFAPDAEPPSTAPST